MNKPIYGTGPVASNECPDKQTTLINAITDANRIFAAIPAESNRDKATSGLANLRQQICLSLGIPYTPVDPTTSNVKSRSKQNREDLFKEGPNGKITFDKSYMAPKQASDTQSQTSNQTSIQTSSQTSIQKSKQSSNQTTNSRTDTNVSFSRASSPTPQGQRSQPKGPVLKKYVQPV
jgi:hypothetical protein